jgi:hypothetical protein
MTQDPVYRTSDPYYAAYLRLAGLAFCGVEEVDGRSWFLFETSPGIRALKTEYYSGTVRVPAFEFAKGIRTMKALLSSSGGKSRGS